MRARIATSFRGALLLAATASGAVLTLLTTPAVALAADVRPRTAVSAGSPRIYRVSQEDTNKDRAPDLTIIDCAIQTPNDRVLVFDGGGNMRASDRWEDATDFTDDTWVFDIGGNGGRNRATLIIAFSRDGNETVARVYDGSLANPDATDGAVRYETSGPDVHVVEPAFPSLIIRVKGNWTRPDGGLNYNLVWQYDGPAASREYSPVYPFAFRLDGGSDMEAAAGDDDGDGTADYSWYTLTAAVPASERIPRSSISVNSAHHRPAPLQGIIFWPLLNQPDDPKGKNYYDSPLFLGIDWHKGLITSFGFLGYPIEEGYHVNSLTRMKRNQVNVLDFENPMAYYDLAGDRDGRPELFIRFAYTPPGDEHFVTGGPTRGPVEMAQYSWNQKNHPELRWDYKVDLAGRNPISQTVKVGEMAVEQVPYEKLPRWVVDHPWGLATLVAWETGNGYLSSEGIYDWSTLEGVQTYGGMNGGSAVRGVNSYTSSSVMSVPGAEQVQRDYLAGVSTQSPESLYGRILSGFRGEFADVNGKVELYFSPIDARLHLVGAAHGVYNAGASGRRVEYENLDGDAYIDSWRVYQGTEEVVGLRQLAPEGRAGGFLVYNADNRVVILQSALPRETFRTQPPADHDEWTRLGAKLDGARRDLLPDDLEGMLASLEAQQPASQKMTLTGADLHDYRPLGTDGFRFVLDLRQGFTVANTPGAAMFGVGALRPGTYVVTYDPGLEGGPWSVRPWTPPAISAEILDAKLAQGEPGVVPIVVRNAGLQDVTDAVVELWAVPALGESTLVTTRTLTLNAETEMTARLRWAPPYAGAWTLRPRVTLDAAGLADAQGTDLSQAPIGRSSVPASAGGADATTAMTDRVVIVASRDAAAATVLKATSSPVAVILSVLGFASCAVLAGWTVWKYWGRQPIPTRSYPWR